MLSNLFVVFQNNSKEEAGCQTDSPSMVSLGIQTCAENIDYEFRKLRKRSISSEDESYGEKGKLVKVDVDLDSEEPESDVSPMKAFQAPMSAYYRRRLDMSCSSTDVSPVKPVKELADVANYESSDLPAPSETDESYAPSHSCTETDENAGSDECMSNFSRNYIVFGSQLQELFTTCRTIGCGALVMHNEDNPRISVTGSAVVVVAECINGHINRWSSQPQTGNFFTGNLLLSSAVFLHGYSYQDFETVLKAVGINVVTQREYYNLQSAYIIPSVDIFWDQHIEAVLCVFQGTDELKVCGDGRCDSPGYCATYGTYTVMDYSSTLIMAQETVRVTEVKNSYWMETEGLDRCLKFLDDHSVQVQVLATDQHPAATKLMRTEYPRIRHQFDLWHICKNLKKKLMAGKDSDLTPWCPAIANHLWYCAMTCENSALLLKEKWVSLLEHISNVHSWEHGELFFRCDHAEYSEEESKKRPWLKDTGKAFKTLKKHVLDDRLLKSLEKVTDGIHTGGLESLHALYTKYAPKRKTYEPKAFTARLRLAALDHNYNVQREQAVSATGKTAVKVQFSKAAKAYVIKKVPVKKTHEYIEEIVQMIMCKAAEKTSISAIKLPYQKPKSLGEHHGIEKKEEDLLEKFYSRFPNKKS